VATEETLGGVKAAAAGEDDTVEVKIGEDGKLYAPTYPTDATESVSGLVKKAANQADSIAEDTATLVTDFNALLAKLKAAGLMAADEE
jgi:biopolymer transport protein ExbD